MPQVNIETPAGTLAGGTLLDGAVVPHDLFQGVMGLFSAGWTLKVGESLFDSKSIYDGSYRELGWKATAPDGQKYGNRYLFDAPLDNPDVFRDTWTTMLTEFVETGFKVSRFPYTETELHPAV